MDSKKTCLTCREEQELQFEKGSYQYHRCPACGLLSTYPIPDAATIEAHYARAFQVGNYRLGQEYMKDYLSVYRGLVAALEERLAAQGRALPGMRILDIGCFSGELLELFQEKGADVYGCELQEDAVRIANEKLPGRIFKTDVFSNDFPAMTYDVVVMSGVIEHVVDPEKLLRRATEMLVPEGTLMVQTPDSGSVLARIMRKHWPPCAPVEHIHLFSRRSMERKLREIGLREVQFRSHWKKLPIAYVYHNFRNFGPEFFTLLKPLYQLLPVSLTRTTLPFYIGEFIVFAQRV